MLGLLEDGVPTLGVIDLPFLGVRVDSGAVADVGSLEDGIIGMGDAFHRGGARLDAYLELTMTVHRRALRSLRRRGIGALGLARHRPDQGMLLAHNNPYDVVAGHAIARAAGGDMHRLRGRHAHPGVERSHGGRPGIQPELVSLAADLAASGGAKAEKFNARSDAPPGTSGFGLDLSVYMTMMTVCGFSAVVTSPMAGSRRLLFTRRAREGPVRPGGCCVRRVRRPGAL